MKIRLGPSGVGSVKDIENTFEQFAGVGIKAAEIPFTYSIFIRDEKTAEKVRKAAEKFDISLSIHSPYWINLNSIEKEKVESSKKRILKCLEVGTWLNARKVVFHAGFYGKMSKKESYENIKNVIIDLQKIRKEKKYMPELAPETMGKINVFGSLEEISSLVNDTGCSFCIDFAHVLARYGKYQFDEIEKLFKQKEWHCHFSGIEYGEKGEKKHITTEKLYWKKLFDNLSKTKEYVIINEGPNPFEDSVAGLDVLHKGLKK